MTHTKVFVGNLSFKTKDSELAAEFTAAGNVKSANIITRGPRSLGYGFVELETEEEAQKAVSLMNRKNIDGREINVELAKPRDENKQTEKRRPPPRRRTRGGPPRGRGGGGFGDGLRQYRRRSQYRPRDGNQGTGPTGGGGGGGRGRGRRPGGPPRNANAGTRTPSKTTLFVANLPFSVDDEGLLATFKELNPVKAHVVKNRSQRSKGFGFVEFGNETDQKAALTAFEKKNVEGRELIVKIALTEMETKKAEGGSNKKEGQPEEDKKEPAQAENKEGEKEGQKTQ